MTYYSSIALLFFSQDLVQLFQDLRKILILTKSLNLFQAYLLVVRLVFLQTHAGLNKLNLSSFQFFDLLFVLEDQTFDFGSFI